MLALPLIVVANWLTGRQLRRFFGRRDTDLVADLFITIAFGTAINGWLAILLAEIGQFKPLPIALLWVLTLLIPQLTKWLQREKPSPQPAPSGRGSVFSPSRLWERGLGGEGFLFLWLPLAAFLFLRPHQFIKGAADAGVYINIASNLAETGRLLIYDEPLATLDPALYPALLREVPAGGVEQFLYLPGFYVESVGNGEITPQFYPLFPVWQAVGVLLGGVEEGLRMTGLWAMLGVVAVFLLARDLDRGIGRWLLLAGLTLNALQLWFARYPTTETLAQFTLWAGIWAFTRLFDARDEDKRLFALLAALMFGSALFTRIDLFPLALLPLLLLILQAAHPIKNLPTSTQLLFHIPFLGMVVHIFTHAYVQSKPYFIGILGWELIVQLRNPIMLFGLLFTGFLFTASLFLVKRTAIDWSGIWRIVRVGVVIGIVGLAVWGWWIRPNSPIPFYNDWYSGQPVFIYDSQNLIRLGWYLGFSGVWLGIIGACWLLWRIKIQTILLLGTGTFFTLLYVWKLRATFAQIYAMRRYVPITLPFLILCAALLLGWLITRKAVWQKAIGAGLTIIWLGSLLWLSRGFVTQVNDVGAIAQVGTLADTFAQKSILIFNDPNPISDTEFVGTPLRFIHQHHVFGLRDLTNFDPFIFSTQLEHWQALGYSLYWVDSPAANAHAWPLNPAQLGTPQPYLIELSALEESAEHKPSQIIPYGFSGTIYPIMSREEVSGNPIPETQFQNPNLHR